jgi:hypothetical protein
VSGGKSRHGELGKKMGFKIWINIVNHQLAPILDIYLDQLMLMINVGLNIKFVITDMGFPYVSDD